MPALFTALILTLISIPLLIRIAFHFNWLDHPNSRKHHHGATPVVGGLAMSFGIAITAILNFPNDHIFWVIFFATSMIVLIGFLDDWKNLPVSLRFLTQGAAAFLAVEIAGLQLNHLGDLFGFGVISLGFAAIPLTIFATVGMANALNLSDGMDGLAGGLSVIATGFMASVAYMNGMVLEFEALLILAGVLIGFLIFNMRFPWQKRAKIFMGDSGSLMVGFLLGLAAIMVTQNEVKSIPPAAVLWFFAIPLCDTVSLMFRRLMKGKSPFHPGRDHLHHILLRVGYTDSQVVRFILAISFLLGLIGFLGWHFGLPDHVLFFGFLIFFALYFAGVHHAWKLMRLMVPAPFNRLSRKSTILE
jgi:UDP-GlcNAc:undecaprenyl-phosphate/decaprenyl-phosphate GlcNAc-1-phosphate transferase